MVRKLPRAFLGKNMENSTQKIEIKMTWYSYFWVFGIRFLFLFCISPLPALKMADIIVNKYSWALVMVVHRKYLIFLGTLKTTLLSETHKVQLFWLLFKSQFSPSMLSPWRVKGAQLIALLIKTNLPKLHCVHQGYWSGWRHWLLVSHHLWFSHSKGCIWLLYWDLRVRA